jgi:hypothetical protein
MIRKRYSPLVTDSALCGMAAPIIFAITVIIAGFLTPGYDPLTQLIGELGIPGEPFAPVVNIIAFGLVGILLIIFTYAMYHAFRSRWTVTLGSALVALAGVSFLFMAFVHCDMGNTISFLGNLFMVFRFLSIASAVMAAFTYMFIMFREETWDGYWQYSLVTGILVIAILPFFLSFPDFSGLLQRIMVALVFLWIEFIAFRIFKMTTR